MFGVGIVEMVLIVGFLVVTVVGAVVLVVLVRRSRRHDDEFPAFRPAMPPPIGEPLPPPIGTPIAPEESGGSEEQGGPGETRV